MECPGGVGAAVPRGATQGLLLPSSRQGRLPTQTQGLHFSPRGMMTVVVVVLFVVLEFYFFLNLPSSLLLHPQSEYINPCSSFVGLFTGEWRRDRHVGFCGVWGGSGRVWYGPLSPTLLSQWRFLRPRPFSLVLSLSPWVSKY